MSRVYQNYYHFRDRLKIRFNLHININEYRDLCKSNDFLIIKKYDDKIEIEIYFKGTKLRCFKYPEEIGGRLSTCFKRV